MFSIFLSSLILPYSRIFTLSSLSFLSFLLHSSLLSICPFICLSVYLSPSLSVSCPPYVSLCCFLLLTLAISSLLLLSFSFFAFLTAFPVYLSISLFVYASPSHASFIPSLFLSFFISSFNSFLSSSLVSSIIFRSIFLHKKNSFIYFFWFSFLTFNEPNTV